MGRIANLRVKDVNWVVESSSNGGKVNGDSDGVTILMDFQSSKMCYIKGVFYQMGS